MSAIALILAREVLDSRGNPTLEVEVHLATGAIGRALVPSGASTGSREAHELRDGDLGRFRGRGVTRARDNVTGPLQEAVLGLDATRQAEIDRVLIAADGSADKSRLGANALLGISLATAHAAASELGLPLYRYLGGARARRLPVPLMNVLNGGLHADNGLDVQEFMIAPLGAPTFAEALRAGVETFHALRELLVQRGLSTAIGDEGGFAPHVKSHREALELLVTAIERAGRRPGEDIAIALDAAASEWVRDGAYDLPRENRKGLTAADLVATYREWAGDFPIVSIEDGLGESDWEGWTALTGALGDRVQVVGDDLLVTDAATVREAVRRRAATALLVKPNQAGTLTETFAAIDAAHAAAWATVVSHRSGETEDVSIADLAVATGAGQVKTGAPCRGERTAKYNQLLRIEEDLGDDALYAGRDGFRFRAGAAGAAGSP